MSSARDFVLEVIEKYKELECLWKVSHDDYHDKNKKNSAFEELVTLFRTKDLRANKETVQKKINSLRCAFKKEHNKVKASVRSGTGADDVHIPKLWYYDHMLFLHEQETPRPSRAMGSILDDMPFGDTQEICEDVEDVQSPQSQISTVSRQSQASASLSFKKTKANADAVLDKISSRLDTMSGTEKKRKNLDAFGEHVAEELRSMPEKMQKICMKIINDAMFQAVMGNLDMTSRIVTDQPTLYFTQPDISNVTVGDRTENVMFAEPSESFNSQSIRQTSSTVNTANPIIIQGHGQTQDQENINPNTIQVMSNYLIKSQDNTNSKDIIHDSYMNA